MKKLYRHGEIVFEKTDKLPDNLEATKTNLLSAGKKGNAHTFRGGKIFLRKEDEFVFGYFEAKNTTLYHLEHGERKSKGLLSAKLPDGYYILRTQNEFTPEGLKQVID